MTDWNDDDNTGIAKLRKQFKEQGTLLKQQQDLINQLMAERNAVGVADALANRGLDPRVAKFYPKDLGTDDASVNQWVEENKELFGNRRVVEQGQQTQDTLTDAERRGYQAINDIAAYESAVQMDLKSRLDAIQFDRNDPDKAQQELMNVLKEFEGYINT